MKNEGDSLSGHEVTGLQSVGHTEMDYSWRSGSESSRLHSDNVEGLSRHTYDPGRSRGRRASGGFGRGGRRFDILQDGRRGAQSLDSLLGPSVNESRATFDNGYHSRGGRSRGRGSGEGDYVHHSRGGRSRGRGSSEGDTGYFSRGGRSRGRGSSEDCAHHSRGGRGRGNGGGWGGPVSHRREREYPMGYKELERLLMLPSDAIALELLREHSGFHLLLKEENMKDEKFILLAEVLAHATNTKSNKESLYELFSITCEPRFMDKLSSFSMCVKRKYLDKAKEYFTHLLDFLNSYSNAMTSIAIDRVPCVIDACIAALMHLKQQAFVSQELINKYEALQDMLTEATKQWQQDKRFGHEGRKRKQDEMDDMEPPDDFRQMSVLPTSQDLVKIDRPFLRKNIVKGKYRDENHYLDVQFRLLREDFVKPLRNGICDFRGDVKSRFKDIRIYRNVSVVGTMFNHRKMMHLVKLNLPRHVKSIETSKRLLYGNLLCFSNDNFKTLIFASVAERNVETYKNEGVIGVQFESDIEGLNFTRNFVMAESRAYFMAYKHVLKALQDMAINGVAMAPYIIHVNPNVDPPKYLGHSETEKYDLRVMKEMKYMNKAEACSRLFRFEDETEELDADAMPHLREVFVQRDLITWPTESDLGLDGSQRRALRSALTRQLAIIQGPPGTGKTFIGLKITQILLHNSKVWKNLGHPTPILVVCFTNHALDQFLEGMTHYTNNIVRVGSRSKSDSINRFQVNNLIRSLHGQRGMPKAIHERNMNLRHEVMNLEREIKNMRETWDACGKPKGIISLKNFSGKNIIPQHLEQQLSQVGLLHWLLLSVNPEVMGRMEKQKRMPSSHPVGDAVNKKANPVGNPTKNDSSDFGNFVCEEDLELGEVVDDEEYNDAEEFLEQEEQDRRLGDEDGDQEDEDTHSYDVYYEVTDHELALEMELADAAWQKDGNNFQAYFQYNILNGQREALRIGLDLSVNVADAANLERQAYLNLLKLDFPSRWLLYKGWTSKLQESIAKQLTKMESKYQRKSRGLEEIKNQEYLYLMRHASVVGMTTTGAAQYSSIMQDLAPSIVIIEEAAEILESHVITSLTAKCQHLIMIGDHQQLRPSATVFELATKYGLDTSLFERLIKNGLAYETLEYQHRMRPSISRLLVPSIYPELKDHSSVSTHPHVRGIASDVFFINHDIPEREESDDNNSHENQHEAELVMGLCRHLMLQGYSPDEVTILTPYSGQFFLLRRLQRQNAVCQGVKICVVDNFQGEENNIILLSLVRSNVDGKVGFLRTDNRVCVALSRAKHGMYITGNMDLLAGSSDLWKKIRSDLLKDQSFGSSLTLKCENHPDESINITKGSDFLSKSPEGGCLQTCNKNLPNCDHTCPRLCHMDDPGHITYKCRVPCPKILCALDHGCPKQCHESCDPCKVLVEKLFPCGHKNTIPCHVDPENFRCPVIVEKELDLCQHSVKMPCHSDTKTYPCPNDCDTRLDCGHQCRLNCHRSRDPDHLNYNCKQLCTKLNAGCTQNHPCQRYCYEDCGKCIVKVNKDLPCGHEAKNVECYSTHESIQCKKKCKRTLPCGHACKKVCYVPCDPCPVKVKKTVPECKHEALVECGTPATTDACGGKCPKILPCSHMCLEKCKDVCTTKCKALVVTTTRCPKNHPIKIPCHLVDKVTGEDAWRYCDAPCQQRLNCDHQCMGQCGNCFQGRLHVSCKKPCNRPLVCGHICKYPCSADCPPCQENCNWKCGHSRCRKKCGIPCAPCKEQCRNRCEHKQCRNKCGSTCSIIPCQHPCPKKLKCGHQCVGFCGDPCPPLCRTCDQEELTGFILLGFEEDADARFVLLEDCGHSIEVQGLEGWLAQDNEEIGMKTCPKCRKPIYNNRRYQNIVIDTYKDVHKVKSKYFTSKVKVKRKDIELVLQDPGVTSQFTTEVQQIMKEIGIDPTRKRYGKQKFCSEAELNLHLFQAQVLKRASEILRKATVQEPNTSTHAMLGLLRRGHRAPSKHEIRLRPRVEEVVKKVMEMLLTVAPQMEEEVRCELQRLMVLPAYWTFLEKFNGNGTTALQEINAKLEKLMDPTVKYGDDTDGKVRTLLKESEKYVGGLGISDSERMMIVKAIGLRQGHWYKCPKGHVYCIGECGGAMVESKCPECGACIGGASHRLRSDNAVAREMDGARHGAWSDQNNMGNFDLNNI